MTIRLGVPLVFLACVGCVAVRSSGSQPRVRPASEAGLPLSSAAWPGLGEAVAHTPVAGWTSAAQTEHPLVGRIWDVNARAFVTEEALVSALKAARFILLGEKHDNGDHHVLQAHLLVQVAGPDLPVVFEMLDDEDQVAGATDAAGLAAAVSWAESGWPDFSLYRPVFTAVYDAGARPLSGHPSRADLSTVMKTGLAALSPEKRLDLGVQTTDRAAVLEPMRSALREAHCGHGGEAMLEPMVLGQRVKDAWMARALRRSAASGRSPAAVLVAGGEHVRPDRAVPQYLEGAVSLRFEEVPRPGQAASPASFQGAADFVWFTPRLDDRDPCEVFAEQLEGMGSH